VSVRGAHTARLTITFETSGYHVDTEDFDTVSITVEQA
jgi:hypothetical protein